MASLHKDPRGKSPFFFCAFTDANGVRRFKSTKETKRKRAQAVAAGWQKAVDLSKRGTLTQVQASKVVSEIYESVNQEPLNKSDTESFLRDWIESKKLTSAPSTARRYEDVIEDFLKHLGTKAKRSVAGLQPRDIASYRDEQIKSGKANKTANLVLKTLRSALGVARKRGIILHNPAEAVDALPDNSGSRETFTRQQITALLAVADSEWRGMILVGACHGLRLMDAAKLTWANVDTEKGVLSFYPQKVARAAKRKPLELPMHPDVLDYLLKLPIRSNRPDAPIFPALSRKKGTGANGLSDSFTRLMVNAGIHRAAEVEKVEGAGRRFFALSYHSFRHTAISEQANAGVAKELRMKLSGHKSAVHERYTHHELETLRQQVERVPSFVKISGEGASPNG